MHSSAVLEGDGVCISKILARQPSIGHSSRLLNDGPSCQATVPFEWEMRPGKPKNPQQQQIVPPLSPPPSMHNLGQHVPAINDHSEAKKSSNAKTSKIWILERAVRKIIKVVLIPNKKISKQELGSRFEYLPDGEFVESRFSSCSCSSIPSNGRFDNHFSGLPRLSTSEVARSIPGKASASLVRIARRV